MEQSNQKIITLSFVLTGFLTFMVVGIVMSTLAAASATFGNFYRVDAVRHGLPVILGFLAFALLQFNPKVQTWADEAVTEVRKVVWPTKKDTTAMTIVCCVMLLMASVVLGVFDFLSRTIITMIIN